MRMDDKALAAWIEGRVRQASGSWTSTLAAERTLVQKYYDGLEPKPLHAGNSKFVSQDVYEGVEAMKAQLLEVFASNAKPDAELVDLDLDSATQTVKSATMVSKRDTSQVRLEVVPPEEFGISQAATSAESAEVVFRTGLRTADELTRMGVPKKLLRQMQGDDGMWLAKDDEKVNRHFETSDFGPASRDDLDDDDKSRQLKVSDTYARVDLDGRPKLWRILVGGGQVLLKKPVRRLPFVFFTPLPRPHAFWGSSYAKKIIPIQNAKTLLQRSIIDHALITNNPKIQVVQGGLPNPRELM